MSQHSKAAVLIVGDSGSGKSTTFRNLPADRTVYLNTENKPLPFEAADAFKVVNITTHQILEDLVKLLKSKEGEKYDYVVLDSMTAVSETIEILTNYKYSGFDIWRNYNDITMRTIRQIKDLPQQVFVTALPETKEESFGNYKEYAKIKGKELKYGYIESNFSIVLHTQQVFNEETEELNEVVLQYKSNRKNTAKAPVGMFTGKLPNDVVPIITQIRDYYGKQSTTT